MLMLKTPLKLCHTLQLSLDYLFYVWNSRWVCLFFYGTYSYITIWKL